VKRARTQKFDGSRTIRLLHSCGERNGRTTKIESGKGNCEGGGPAVGSDFGSGGPKAVPTGIDDGVSAWRREFLDDSAVALRAEGIDLENVGIAMAEGGVDGDGEIVIEVLGEIAAELRGDDGGGGGVVAMNADVKVAGVIEDADLGFFGGGLGFERFALAEIGEQGGAGPERVVERAIEARRVVGAGGGSGSGAGGGKLSGDLQKWSGQEKQ